MTEIPYPYPRRTPEEVTAERIRKAMAKWADVTSPGEVELLDRAADLLEKLGDPS